MKTARGNGRSTGVAASPRFGRFGRVAAARRRVGRRGLSLAVLAFVPLAAAACGGSGSPGVASLRTTTTRTAAASSGRPLDRFAACMRTHGVPQFPDPPNNDTNVKILIGGSGIRPDTPQFNAAQQACSGLLPNGGGGPGPTITPADRLDYLKAVACVRAHGVPNFPDPTYVDGEPTFTIPSSISRTSPVVLKAIATCRKLIPAGLPYSH